MNLRRIIWGYQDWFRRRRLAKACPEHARLRAQRNDPAKRYGVSKKLYRDHVTLTSGLLKR